MRAIKHAFGGTQLAVRQRRGCSLLSSFLSVVCVCVLCGFVAKRASNRKAQTVLDRSNRTRSSEAPTRTYIYIYFQNTQTASIQTSSENRQQTSKDRPENTSRFSFSTRELKIPTAHHLQNVCGSQQPPGIMLYSLWRLSWRARLARLLAFGSCNWETARSTTSAEDLRNKNKTRRQACRTCVCAHGQHRATEPTSQTRKHAQVSKRKQGGDLFACVDSHKQARKIKSINRRRKKRETHYSANKDPAEKMVLQASRTPLVLFSRLHATKTITTRVGLNMERRVREGSRTHTSTTRTRS